MLTCRTSKGVGNHCLCSYVGLLGSCSGPSNSNVKCNSVQSHLLLHLKDKARAARLASEFFLLMDHLISAASQMTAASRAPTLEPKVGFDVNLGHHVTVLGVVCCVGSQSTTRLYRVKHQDLGMQSTSEKLASECVVGNGQAARYMWLQERVNHGDAVTTAMTHERLTTLFVRGTESSSYLDVQDSRETH